MTAPLGGIGLPVPVPDAEHAKLREKSQELEGFFMSYLFRAMRATVPEGGILNGGQAGQMFTQMMDDNLARQAALRTEGSMGDDLYRQLARKMAVAELRSGDGGESR